MDPVTQGLLGAVAAQAVVGPRGGHRVWIAGLGAGMLPDADVILQPISDPALPWEYHRHFTHAFVMAPVMGALAALVLCILPGFRRVRRLVLAAAIVGALTHAPLDLCTSYGTKVFWPFSLENATLDLFPIIDPVFTLVLLVGLAIAAWRKTRGAVLVACAFVALYTGAAVYQRGAAMDAQAALLAARDHAPARARVMPLPASLLAWRSLYEVDERMVADLLRIAPGTDPYVIEGGSRRRLRADALPADERVRSVYARFAHFAQDWTAFLADDRSFVADMRFSQEPGFQPLWGLRLADAPGEPKVAWEQRPFSGDAAGALLDVILGRSADLRPLDTVVAQGSSVPPSPRTRRTRR